MEMFHLADLTGNDARLELCINLYSMYLDLEFASGKSVQSSFTKRIDVCFALHNLLHMVRLYSDAKNI